MKKTLLLTLLLVISFATALRAQGDFHLGFIQNTLNTKTTTVVGNITSSTMQIGEYAGFSYNIDLNHNFGLLLGAEAEHFSISDTAGLLTGKTMLINVNVPVMLNFSLRFRKVRLTASGGLSMNMGILSNTKIESIGEIDNYADVEIMDRYSWGLNYGARLSYGKIGVHAMWLYGLTDLNKSDNIETTSSRMMVGVDIQF